MGIIWIISGPIGAGKTTFCRRVVGLAEQRGWNCAGILSPACFEQGEKIGIDVFELHTRQTYRLASRPGGQEPTPGTPGWKFDPEALTRGSAAFHSAIPCDLLVVDELGPLELERSEGWMAAIAAVNSRAYRLALLVIRPSLVNTALQKWPSARLLSIDRLREGLVEIPEDILYILNSDAEPDKIGGHPGA